ncbi:MAG: hypothetical protein PVH03_14130 [Chloroflexota bacterium]|jgi:hypothetical protein
MNELSATKEASRYQTYLLTCWQERDKVKGMAIWRFRLETPRSGHRRIFTTLEEVMSIIEIELNPKRD